jgi:hypothetical protein
LEAFRAEFMGRQWGVAAEFLLAGKAYTFEQACAFSLLHDVPVRPGDPGTELRLMAGIWRAMDEFGRAGAEWLPYWRNGDLARTSPTGVHASLYRHPLRGLLVVLSNLGRDTATAELTLELARLGLPAAGRDGPRVLVAVDAISGEPLPAEIHGSRARLAVPGLPPLGWKLIRLGAQTER